MKYLAILSLYGIAGYIDRGWFDIYGLMTVSLLVIALAMTEKARER